jgi:hypothetical protein
VGIKVVFRLPGPNAASRPPWSESRHQPHLTGCQAVAEAWSSQARHSRHFEGHRAGARKPSVHHRQCYYWSYRCPLSTLTTTCRSGSAVPESAMLKRCHLPPKSCCRCAYRCSSRRPAHRYAHPWERWPAPEVRHARRPMPVGRPVHVHSVGCSAAWYCAQLGCCQIQPIRPLSFLFSD